MNHKTDLTEVFEELVNIVKNKEPLSEQWITPEQLEKELGITIATQNRLRSDRQIPFTKVGKYIKYNKQVINDWLLNNMIKVTE